MKKSIKFLVLIGLVVLSSCGGMVKNAALKKTTIENEAIPSGFGKESSVLICKLVYRNSIDRYMKKHIENNYKGKYEFVTKNNLFSSKYDNKDKYRYVFEHKTTNANPISGPNYSVFSYQIRDRKTNKTYTNGVYSSYFSKLIEAYVLAMERARTKNK